MTDSILQFLTTTPSSISSELIRVEIINLQAIYHELPKKRHRRTQEDKEQNLFSPEFNSDQHHLLPPQDHEEKYSTELKRLADCAI